MKLNNGKKLTALVLAIVMLATIVSAAIPASAAVSDVTPNNWAYEAVQYNVENKLIAVDYDTYNMNAPAPRQDVAYALFKLANGRDVEPSQSEHTQYIPQDMQNSPDKYKYSVQWAVQNSVILGTKSQGSHDSAGYKVWFSPAGIVTREQMATLLHRMAAYDGLETNNYSTTLLDNFTDGRTTSAWAQNAMAWCISNHFMKGVGNNKLSPKITLSFGQLAQVMMNYGEFRSAAIETPEPSESPDPTPTPDPTPSPAPSTDPDHMDLSGPWDHVQPITELPIGGYMKEGHRYNKYDVCIDTVDGIPTDEEKLAFLLVNEYRVSKGVIPLIWDQSAQVIMETRALEGFKCHTERTSAWAHCRPNGDGGAGMDGPETGIIYEWSNAGSLKNHKFDSFLWENAAWGENCYKTDDSAYDKYYGYTGFGPKDVVDAWIESPGHEAALVRDTNNNTKLYGAVALSHLETDVESFSWGNMELCYWYYGSIEVYD